MSQSTATTERVTGDRSMMPPERELELHRFLARSWARLGEARDPEQAVRSLARDLPRLVGADAVCIAAVGARAVRASIEFAAPPDAVWDAAAIADFYREKRPPIRPDLAMAPLRRHERPWRVLALQRRDRPFDRHDRAALSHVAADATKLVRGIDRERLAEVRSRIERKIMEELHPKDLFYQILHGLRSLTGYDHSSALLIAGEGQDALELVAEQIAWRKGRSNRIGARFALEPGLRRLLLAGGAFGFTREGAAWREWTAGGASGLAELLDFDHEGAQSAEREGEMLCAPIVTRDGVTGVLKVAAVLPQSFGPYELGLVERFVPPVSVAIQNSRRAATLESRMLEAEKKHAMADLARGVAHDLNNALGTILPLLQQLRLDCRAGRIRPEVLAADLDEIEGSMQVCRRIFGGMLSFARGVGRGPGHAELRRAVENALTLLQDGLDRRRVQVEVALETELPAVRAPQSELDQVLFNLMSNARDAMPDGGRLRVEARLADGQVHVAVEDDGSGIPAAILSRIQEPFFTTKPQGSGLGLAICRSLVWGMGGQMKLSSREGEGTRVDLLLPVDPVRAEG
jgi:signal transduction histidine kinase